MYNSNLIFYINGFVNNIIISEDLAADTFAKLIIRKISLRNDYMFKTWLFKIARNNAIDYLRKQSKWRFTSFDLLETEFADVEALERTIVLGKNIKQIKNLIYRAKHTLRLALEKENFAYENI